MNSIQDFVTTKYNLFLSDIKAGLFSTTMPAPTPTSEMAIPGTLAPPAPPTNVMTTPGTLPSAAASTTIPTVGNPQGLAY